MFFALLIFNELENATEKSMETRRQLINFLYHQHQTWEYRSVHQRSLTTWTWLELFQISFFPSSSFNYETYLVKELKCSISLIVSMSVDLKDNFGQQKVLRYLKEIMSGFEASFQLWKLKLAIKKQYHSIQQNLAVKMCRRQYDLSHWQFDKW